MVDKGKGKKSKFNLLNFIWIIVGVLFIFVLVECLLLINRVKDYFP